MPLWWGSAVYHTLICWLGGNDFAIHQMYIQHYLYVPISCYGPLWRETAWWSNDSKPMNHKSRTCNTTSVCNMTADQWHFEHGLTPSKISTADVWVTSREATEMRKDLQAGKGWSMVRGALLPPVPDRGPTQYHLLTATCRTPLSGLNTTARIAMGKGNAFKIWDGLFTLLDSYWPMNLPLWNSHRSSYDAAEKITAFKISDDLHLPRLSLTYDIATVEHEPPYGV